MTLTCCQDHILTENIWFVWSETSYSGDERRCYRCGTTTERTLKIELLSQWKMEAEFRKYKTSSRGSAGCELCENTFANGCLSCNSQKSLSFNGTKYFLCLAATLLMCRIMILFQPLGSVQMEMIKKSKCR